MNTRHWLLNYHSQQIINNIKNGVLEGMDDPVGMVIDVSDEFGYNLALAVVEKNGIPDSTIENLIAECKDKNQIPTLQIAVEMETVKKILPFTSATALNSIAKFEQMRKPNHYLAVIMAEKGNTYAAIEVDVVRVNDGHYRIKNT